VSLGYSHDEYLLRTSYSTSTYSTPSSTGRYLPNLFWLGRSEPLRDGSISLPQLARSSTVHSCLVLPSNRTRAQLSGHKRNITIISTIASTSTSTFAPRGIAIASSLYHSSGRLLGNSCLVLAPVFPFSGSETSISQLVYPVSVRPRQLGSIASLRIPGPGALHHVAPISPSISSLSLTKPTPFRSHPFPISAIALRTGAQSHRRAGRRAIDQSTYLESVCGLPPEVPACSLSPSLSLALPRAVCQYL
jgi:hypothetical protein